MFGKITASTFLLVGVLLAITLFGANSCRRSTVRLEEVNETIKREIPLGSTVNQVLEFLDSYTFGTYRFKRGAYRDDPDSLHMLVEYSNFDNKPQELKNRLGGFVGAAILNVEGGLFTGKSIVVRFYFDKERRLIDYTVKDQVEK